MLGKQALDRSRRSRQRCAGERGSLGATQPRNGDQRGECERSVAFAAYQIKLSTVLAR